MASRALKINPKNSVTSDPDNAVEPRAPETVTVNEIALRAYQLWQERGCPIGSPEQDWLEAERQFALAQRSTAESVDERLGGRQTRTALPRQRRSSGGLSWLDQPPSLSLPHFYVRSWSEIRAVTEIEQGVRIY